jgi:hypothetical protein
MNSDDDEFKILLGRIGNRGRSESSSTRCCAP